jgi:hypothetical protein
LGRRALDPQVSDRKRCTTGHLTWSAATVTGEVKNSSASIAEELTRLAELRDRGVIDEAAFQQLKEGVLPESL